MGLVDGPPKERDTQVQFMLPAKRLDEVEDILKLFQENLNTLLSMMTTAHTEVPRSLKQP